MVSNKDAEIANSLLKIDKKLNLTYEVESNFLSKTCSTERNIAKAMPGSSVIDETSVKTSAQFVDVFIRTIVCCEIVYFEERFKNVIIVVLPANI